MSSFYRGNVFSILRGFVFRIKMLYVYAHSVYEVCCDEKRFFLQPPPTLTSLISQPEEFHRFFVYSAHKMHQKFYQHMVHVLHPLPSPSLWT